MTTNHPKPDEPTKGERMRAVIDTGTTGNNPNIHLEPRTVAERNHCEWIIKNCNEIVQGYGRNSHSFDLEHIQIELAISDNAAQRRRLLCEEVVEELNITKNRILEGLRSWGIRHELDISGDSEAVEKKYTDLIERVRRELGE